jgi:hypothetical protein
MRLELVCAMELAYDADGFALIQPYGGEEGTGFGQGSGNVSGDRLSGSVRWANQPRRRADGWMLPDAHGVIRTDDGAVVMFELRGRTGWVTVEGEKQGIQLLNAIFEAEAEPYRWLNDAVCVVEGVVDPVSLVMQARVYSCVHELVGAPGVAIGSLSEQEQR